MRLTGRTGNWSLAATSKVAAFDERVLRIQENMPTRRTEDVSLLRLPEKPVAATAAWDLPFPKLRGNA